jgi:hypothetical protein
METCCNAAQRGAVRLEHVAAVQENANLSCIETAGNLWNDYLKRAVTTHPTPHPTISEM